MKGVSLKDIAREAGVSTTTVSFVLNGKAKERRISDAVSRRVQELAGRLKYEPNQVARGLRTGKTKTIGLIVEDISNNFFATLAKIIEDEADKYGYKVLYCSTENKVEKARELLHMLHYRQVDGYIITPTHDIEKEIEEFLQAKKPMVLVDRYFPDIPTNYVMVDNFGGAYAVVEHMVKCGYRKIGVVTLASGQVQMRDRLGGFTAAMRDCNIPFGESQCLAIPFGDIRERAVPAIMDLLKQQRPEALFFTTNYLGICGLEAIKQLNFRIPEEIAVISFDDHDLFRLHNPAITCLSQPVSHIGREVVNILMEDMQQQRTVPCRMTLPAELIIRNSCLFSSLESVAV